MKKTPIIILVQFVFIALFFMYALVQKNQADRQREMFVNLERHAEENERRALAQIRLLHEKVEYTEQKLKDCLNTKP